MTESLCLTLPLTHEIEPITFHKKYESDAEKIARCELLRSVQHIDIYGKTKMVYNDSLSRYSTKKSEFVTYDAVSDGIDWLNGPDDDRSLKSPESKVSSASRLDKFSVTTKVSGLWPGNDILTKKTKKIKEGKSGNFFVPRVVMK